ncbi:MAG: hypothetical protein M3468_03000 [Acidobacteriota bacterium]|nr:hypothetical protein [Acidobacteriota bacterium]
MQTIAEFDFFPLVFDRAGALESPDEFETFTARAAGWPASDALFIAHGFRNDVGEATALYTNFLKNVRAHLHRPEFGELASRRYVVAGVYWPSKAFRERYGDDAEGTRGLQNPTLAMADAKQQLEELKTGATLAQRRALDKAAALLPKLERDRDAQDRFVELVLSVLSRSRLDKTEGLPQIKKQPGSQLLAKLDDDAADGTRGVFGSVAGKVGQFLNMTTWYVMKDRSGTVGAKGVADAVRALRKTTPDIRVHLVGHSLGGRLMASCAKSLAVRPKVQPDSLTLLEAAFSHYGFSADNGRGTAGFFRDVIEKKIIKGPFVSTFSSEDTVVGKAYAISSRLARDNSRGVGDAADEFGGIGRNGALKTAEVASWPLHKAGTTYEYAIGMLNNLDGSGGMIKSHGDVTNPAVTYAFTAALART